jgi:hypothetical protein
LIDRDERFAFDANHLARTGSMITFGTRTHGDKHDECCILRSPGTCGRYIANAPTRMDDEFGPGKKPVDGLRSHFAGHVDRTSSANDRPGCLPIAAAMELAGRDAEVDRRVGAFSKAIECRVAA